MIFSVIVLSIGLTIALVYKYLKRNDNHWKDRGILGPCPKLIVGNFPNHFMRKAHMTNELDEIYNLYKTATPLVGMFFGSMPQITIADPGLAHNIFNKNFKQFDTNEFGLVVDKTRDPLFSMNPFVSTGSEWKERRGDITKGLTSMRIKAMYPELEEVCRKMTEYLVDSTDRNAKTFDAKELSYKFVIDSLAACVFGINAKSFTNNETMFAKMARKVFKPTEKLPIIQIITSVFPLLANLFNLKIVPRDCDQFFTNLMKECLEANQNTGHDRLTYMSYMLELQNNKGLSVVELASYTMTFFLDGYETVASLLEHVLYQLAVNTDVQTQLRDELKKSETDSHGPLSFDDLQTIEYLDGVLYETLRLYPPAIALVKVCTETLDLMDYQEKPIKIEAGASVIIPVYSIHRDSRYYPNPDEFHPERFSSESGGVAQYKSQGVFYGFGSGPRQCLGTRYATLIVKAAVAEIVKNFDISLDSRTKEDYELHPNSFLIVRNIGGLWIKLKKLDVHNNYGLLK